MEKTANFRKAIESKKIVALPGIYDSWGAKLVEEVGFQACTISGFLLAGSMGYPDIGLVTMSEIVSRVAYIAESVEIPILADADTGYGSYLNVARTVREFEKAGVASIFIEDQVNPKKCGRLAGKKVIPVKEMIGRIKAALDSRHDNNFLIIARTDALGIYGIDDAIERCNIYIASGVDATFANGLTKTEDFRRFGSEVKGYKLITIPSRENAAATSLSDLEKWGYHLAAFPLQLLMYQLHALRKLLEDLRHKGTIDHLRPEMVLFNDLMRLQKLDQYEEMESRYEKLVLSK